MKIKKTTFILIGDERDQYERFLRDEKENILNVKISENKRRATVKFKVKDKNEGVVKYY